MTESARDRIAQVLYGEGAELAWTRALELADLVCWELGLRPNYCLRCGIPHRGECKRKRGT